MDSIASERRKIDLPHKHKITSVLESVMNGVVIDMAQQGICLESLITVGVYEHAELLKINGSFLVLANSANSAFLFDVLL